MWSSDLTRFAPLATSVAAALFLASCTLEPLNATRSYGSAASDGTSQSIRDIMRTISVDPVKDRVAQFVMETGMHCTVSEDLEGATSGQEEHTSSVETLLASDTKRPEQQKQQQRAKKQQRKNNKADGGEKEATFYASPVVRTAFMAVFTIAKRQSRRKGFAML